MTLRKRKPDADKIYGFNFSFDALCIWIINALWRWAANHPDLLYMVAHLVPIIPGCHVRNHKEFCQYVYNHTYTPYIGHFHGETAEYIWPYLNKLGGQTRQMTNAHRQDTMMQKLNAWNWRKIIRMCTFLSTLAFPLF
jgi:hypothetical protein